ncbi:interleukin-17A-like isoform X5 [Empidonax traillii]|uniref:interleukin-17A-like isoform X5 n=1 Tax=Empidonax traillii TaxID=164674 RepID=UPI000FFD3AB5|nr:interleukin-17A-like isoform X5 [Empidonax traillii]
MKYQLLTSGQQVEGVSEKEKSRALSPCASTQSSREVAMAFSSYTAMFRSLFLVLILALTVRPSKAGASVRLSEDCLNQRDPKFPTSVEVNIRIIKSHHAFRMVHDIRNRSLAPWDYRLDEDPNRFPQEILVLRREQQGCRPTYRLEKKLITVGCTCVTPVIRHHS